ncbi:MAG TPA: hypothetical protein PK537_06195 [Candidatus Limiplasma sp.]|nr:hypothetical protein [Candidatus Limiplasma sp.]
MKKFLMLLLAAALLMQPLAGWAEATSAQDQYVSLATLREQAAEGWNETYTSHGREVVADVDTVTMPEADACPILQVEGIAFDANALAAVEATPNASVNVYRDIVLNVDLKVDDSKIFLDEWYGGIVDTDQEINYENGVVPTEDALECDLTNAQFRERVSSALSDLMGLTLEDYRFDNFSVEGPCYKAKIRNGELVRGDLLTTTGCYAMRATQLLNGIPILDCFADDTPTGWIVYDYFSPGWYTYQFGGTSVVAVQETDVPLLSFDAMKAVLEAQIEAGTLRGVDEMEFGYLNCYQDTDKGRQFVTVPVWRVLCGYTTDLSKEHAMPYYDERDTDGSQSVPECYRDYYYSAQTGEMIQTCALTDSVDPIPAGEILTWDSVGD